LPQYNRKNCGINMKLPSKGRHGFHSNKVFWLNVVLFWLIQFNYILFPFRSRSAQRGVQLTATKQTYFKPLPLDDNILDLVYEPREVLNVVITVISVQR
jgi:hypothetical protein